MKAFIISAIIVCSLITGCKDTPEVQGTAVPDPLFIGAERNSRAIEIEIVDEFKIGAFACSPLKHSLSCILEDIG